MKASKFIILLISIVVLVVINLLLGTEFDRYSDVDTSPYDYYIGSVHYVFSEEGRRKRDEILKRYSGGVLRGASADEAAASDADAFESEISGADARSVLTAAEAAFDSVIVDCPPRADNPTAAWGLNLAQTVLLLTGFLSSAGFWHRAFRRAAGASPRRRCRSACRAATAWTTARSTA